MTRSEMHIVCFVIPFLGKSVRGDLDFSLVINSFLPEEDYDTLATSQINLLAYTLSVVASSGKVGKHIFYFIVL